MITGSALRGVLERIEEKAAQLLISACHNYGITGSEQALQYAVGIFIATVSEDKLNEEEEWLAAAQQSLEVSEIVNEPEDLKDIANTFVQSLLQHCRELAGQVLRMPALGEVCKAILAEDGLWHEAVVEPIEQELIKVRFKQFGKLQNTLREQIVLSEDLANEEGEDTTGCCELCERKMPLTRHHLLPRKTHLKLKKKGYTKEELLASANICRPCHDVIHGAEDEMTLALHYNTIDKLLSHPKINASVKYFHKQRGKR
uniref:Tudor domain-containing protein n=1 Tax=Tetraselmis sp. GSL018 TaxID=582737 RepID=A0A061RQW3_9CHLO